MVWLAAAGRFQIGGNIKIIQIFTDPVPVFPLGRTVFLKTEEVDGLFVTARMLDVYKRQTWGTFPKAWTR